MTEKKKNRISKAMTIGVFIFGVVSFILFKLLPRYSNLIVFIQGIVFLSTIMFLTYLDAGPKKSNESESNGAKSEEPSKEIAESEPTESEEGPDLVRMFLQIVTIAIFIAAYFRLL